MRRAFLLTLAALALGVFTFAAAGSLFAESATSAAGDALYSAPVAEDGKAAVRSVCERLTGSGVMRGDFAQTKEIRSLSRAFRGNGTFVVSKNDGIVWNTLKPFPSLMVVSDGRIVQSAGNGKQSVLDSGGNPVFEQFAATIRSVFSGDADELFSRFEVFYLAGSDGAGKPTGDASNNGTNNEGTSRPWRIGLVPKDSVVRSIISSIELSGIANLDRFIMTESSGDTVRYEFSGQTFSAELNDEERKFFAQ